jgi:hypothetical protein
MTKQLKSLRVFVVSRLFVVSFHFPENLVYGELIRETTWQGHLKWKRKNA